VNLASTYDVFEDENVDLEYVNTKEQVADIFTKALPPQSWDHALRLMGLLQAAGESSDRPAATDESKDRRDTSSEAAALGGATARPRVCTAGPGRDCVPVLASCGIVQKREGGVDEIGSISHFSSYKPLSRKCPNSGRINMFETFYP